MTQLFGHASAKEQTHLDVLLGEAWPCHLLLPLPHEAGDGPTRALIL